MGMYDTERYDTMKFLKKEKAQDGAAPAKRRSRRITALVLAAVLVAGGAAGVMHLVTPKGTDAGGAQAVPVTRQSLIRTLTGTGTLAPAEQFKITPLVTGKVLECTFEEGDTVQKGQLLYRIDPSEANKNIEQAQLSLRQAQLAAGQQAEELGKATVRAEESGAVTEVFVKVGEQVEAGAKIATIRNSAVMLLTVPFNATDAAGFRVGQAASVTVNGNFQTVAGTVKEVDAAETVGEGFQVTRNVTISIPNPGALSPAASGTAVIGGVAGNGGAAFAYSAESTVTAGVSGKVARLEVRKGGKVAAGDVVARLSSTALQNQQENNSIAIQQAEVNLMNARAGLDHFNITAPISGTVVSREVKAGDSLGSGSGTNSMAVIYDLSALVFTIPLDELDVSKVSVGQAVTVRVDALDGRTFDGTVTKISMAGNTEKGKTAYPVTVKIENPPKELLPGMNVNAAIVVAKADNALAVPVAAVQYGDVVYARNKAGGDYPPEDGVPQGFHSVKVGTGVSDGDHVEIKAGLEEGDEVFVPAEAPPSPDPGGMGEGGEMGGDELMLG